MARFNLSTFALVVLSLANPTLALVIPRAGASFKILVSTPTLPTLGADPDSSFAPQYLTINGTATSTPTSAGVFSITASQLYVSGSDSPIGAATGVLGAQVKPLEDAAISTTFAVGDDSVVSWASEDFVKAGGEKEGAFWLRMDGTQSVWAIFGGVWTADAVPATLLAIYQ